MKTTAIMIEFLIVGVLVLLALFFLFVSLFPIETQLFFVKINESQPWLAKAPFFLIIFVSFAYGFGVLFDYIGFIAFEWLNNMVKKKRIKKYYKLNESILKDSPILKDYKGNNKSKNHEEESSYHGEMRFFVLMESPELYSEIELQLKRLKIIRVLFFVELILLSSIIVQLRQKFCAALLLLLLLISVITIANVIAIYQRFDRYCRSIERSYKMLILKQQSLLKT